MSTLRLILGDQLSDSISSLDGCDSSRDIILMCEVWNEATYVKHHKKKIAFLFSAMRHFAEELMRQNYKLEYTKIDDEENAGSFQGEIERILKKLGNKHDIKLVVVKLALRVAEFLLYCVVRSNQGLRKKPAFGRFDLKVWNEWFDCETG